MFSVATGSVWSDVTHCCSLQGTNSTYFGDGCQCDSNTCPRNTDQGPLFDLPCSGKYKQTVYLSQMKCTHFRTVFEFNVAYPWYDSVCMSHDLQWIRCLRSAWWCDCVLDIINIRIWTPHDRTPFCTIIEWLYIFSNLPLCRSWWVHLWYKAV